MLNRISTGTRTFSNQFANFQFDVIAPPGTVNTKIMFTATKISGTSPTCKATISTRLPTVPSVAIYTGAAVADSSSLSIDLAYPPENMTVLMTLGGVSPAYTIAVEVVHYTQAP